MTDKKQTISLEKYWELSDLVLGMCRDVDDQLFLKGGWQGWSTGGMRCMTNNILQKLLEELEVEVESE